MRLIKNIHQQQLQLATEVNQSKKALAGGSGGVPELPGDVNFPLCSHAEVDEFEEWLKNPDSLLSQFMNEISGNNQDLTFCVYLNQA